MNKAFTRDDDDPEPPLVPPRAPLPDGVTNYVTPRGLALLKGELEELDAQRRALDDAGEAERRRALASLSIREAQLMARIRSAALVEPGAQSGSAVRFGARVRVRASAGTESCYEIVGVDEADAARGLIAFTSPLARALIGKGIGEVASVKTPSGLADVEILDVFPAGA